MLSVWGKFIGYSRSILPSSHIRVDPTHHGTHLYVRGREYTLGVSNNSPCLGGTNPPKVLYINWIFEDDHILRHPIINNISHKKIQISLCIIHVC